MTPQGMTDPTTIARELVPYAKLPEKPILASWMGGAEVASGEAVLNAAGIPTFPFPDTAAKVFQYMWRYSYNLRGLYETPTLGDGGNHIGDRSTATRIIEEVRESGRTILTEAESKQLLQSYGLPVVETRIAQTEDEAVA